ncbi:hypothetical protein [Pseudomonas kitaguniensis]|uniref:hypothetical protein n=1 Tax=Pseudomonas kitaguniensis TaxID=2607908 RepID=UPI003D07A0FC
MLRATPPYFFDEFLLPISRKTPSARERALGLTVKDLDWLHNLYYASDAARQDTQLLGYPMRVEKLLINVAGHAPIPIAGAFLISPTPDAGKALFYTPYGGIQVSDNHAALLVAVREQLADAVQRQDLLKFVSIAQRNALPLGTPIALTTATVEGAVMEDQEQTLRVCQQANVQATLEQLQHTPTLPGMLDTLLGIMARINFPGLDQRHTKVNCFIRNTEDGSRRWVDSLPLSEALLQFYVNHAWPKEQTREFANPKHVTTAFTPAQREHDHQQWQTLVEKSANILSKLLESLLQTYWNEDIDNGTSRLELFAQVMAEKFRVDVLLKRQGQIISADESHMLQALFLPDQTARSAYAKTLSVEKVRIHAPYQHYVELASTLMISERRAYLYTQSRGLQVLKDLDDLKDCLLSLLKAAGHEDELLNFLSLDERNVFIGLDQINIAARPITHSVFTGVVEDIARKQIDNMHHALALYRRSDGQVDLAPLLDYALDIRTMLDDRLAPLETAGRWTVHPVTRGNGRPSTVKAERAKLQLQRLEAAQAALAVDRENHPTLRSMVTLVLNTQLQLQQQDLNADEVYINTYATTAEEREERPPVASLSMVEHFIERLSLETPALNDSSRTWLYRPRSQGVAQKLHSMTLKTFNTVINQVLLVFAKHSMRDLTRLFLGNTREKHTHAMLLGLRSEAQLRLLNKTMTPRSEETVDTVLRPDSLLRLTRHGLNGFLPDAYALTLNTGTPPVAQSLANLFVLTERGGIDPQRSGLAILWTPQRGHEVFSSIQTLHEEVTQRLEHPVKRVSLLENLPTAMPAPHQVYQLGQLQRIDDNVLDNRLQTYNDYVMSAVDHLLAMGLGARALQDRLDRVIEQPAPTNLARAIALASSLINQQALPVWLGMAPAADQLHQAELLEQYHNNAPEQEDYLKGITPLRTHTFSALQEQLSAQALSWVQQVFDMPDAVARATLAGATAMIRPLELVATEGATHVKVAGMFLIGAETAASAPLVLYAPYSDNHVLKEYADAHALLDEIDRPGHLQDWVIMHLANPQQAVYRDLLKSDHYRPSEISLASTPVNGHLLHYLFEDTRQILLKMLACQFEKGAKLLWDRAVSLLGDGIPTAVHFMAGKLAYPLVVWRSYTLFKRSAEALQVHHWKAALRDFILGMAEMASLRSELEGTAQSPPTQKEIPLAELSDDTLPTATTLATLNITASSRTRLQPFEAHGIALKDLEQRTAVSVYKDQATLKYYVPLAGKVYSVEKTAHSWRLANDEYAGPCVGCNAHGKWVLDLNLHNPRFGKVLSRIRTRTGEREAINIQATGIRAIAALSSWKAQVITEALNVATYYTVNCKRNIAHFSTLRDPNSRLGIFLGEMFGVISLTPDQLSRIERIVDGLLDALSDPTLTGPNSKRFVSGTSRLNTQLSYAFTLPDDRGKTLYLLDRFFDPCLDEYQNRLNSPFDVSAHARAAVLIHELTHLKFNTEDIAYLDSMRPFSDLVNTTRPGALALKTDMEDMSTTALSTLTPATMLFKTWNTVSAAWEDYGLATSTQEIGRSVLHATGALDLNDARKIFMSNADKRIDTILTNADSVTFLITHLGRQLDSGA